MLGRRLLLTIGCLGAATIATGAVSTAAKNKRPDHIGAHHFVYRARADIDGDGRLDRVFLSRHPAMTGHLAVTLATGRRLALKMQSDAPFVPGLATIGNVNGRRGDELFIDLHHLTTAEIIGVFTFATRPPQAGRQGVRLRQRLHDPLRASIAPHTGPSR